MQVDSANRHGILLEMVQLLTDLDLVIFKSYISSDGGWLMDGLFSFSPLLTIKIQTDGECVTSHCVLRTVFHVADQLGNKLTDPVLIHYVQQVN